MGEAPFVLRLPVFGWARGLRGRVGAMAGWQRYGLALLLGALGALAMPPWHGLPLLLLAFPGLIWLIETAPGPRSAFFIGLAFGFGHFLIGVHWIAHAFLVDADRFAWLAPLAIPGLALYLALFPAAAALAFRLLMGSLGRRAWHRCLLFALTWVVFEWLRGHLLTGFPWTLLGHGWIVSEAMIQTAAVFGSYGLSVVMGIAATMPSLLAEEKPRVAIRSLFGILLLLLFLWGGGTWRLAGAEAPLADRPLTDVHLRLVQANIPQSLKWRPDLQRRHLDRHLALSLGEGFDRATVVIWPEMAVPYLLGRDPKLRRHLAQAVPKGGLLLTGAPRRSPGAKGAAPSNGVVALDERGDIIGGYDKFHLVPFGEYVPLRGLLPISRLVPGIGDFHRGPGPVTLALGSLPPFSPLVCYEVIFPGAVLDKTARPRWLLNVTNDAWFGTSAGPYQHFAAARLRAVEEGLPLVRAANTGISAIIDPYGRVLRRLDLGVAGVLDGPLPAASNPPPYGRFGDWGLLGLLLAGFGLLGTLGRRHPIGL